MEETALVKVGRPSKKTPETEERILNALKAGNTRKASSQYAGIHIDTFCQWMNEFSEFSEAVTMAEAEAEIRFASVVQMAAPKDWKASAWWLERRRPDDWGPKAVITHEGEIKVTVGYERDKAGAAGVAHGADPGGEGQEPF